MYRRRLCDQIYIAMRDTPVIFIKGARQTGKTTLTHQLQHHHKPIPYLTFDDVSVLSAAESDPPGFLAGLPHPVILDEVQRLPGLFVSIKAAVDRDRRPGRFILTGSADVMLAPNLSESLAGELLKQASWSDSRPALLHFRTHAGAEVVLVLETGNGDLAGVEVKSSMSVSEADFRGLKSLAELAGPKFRRGIVLYGGEQIIPFGKNLAALPLQHLWN